MNNLVIKKTEVFGVRRLTKHQYTSESEGFKGKSYFRYRTNGRVFIVHEDDDFNDAYDRKILSEVHLLQTPKEDEPETIQLSLDYFVTQDQLINHATFEVKLESIKAGAGKVFAMSAEEAEDLA